MKNFIPDFTQEELNYIIEAANFTEQQKHLFLLRNKEYTMEQCAEIMNVSDSTVYRIQEKMLVKIAKVTRKMKSTI